MTSKQKDALCLWAAYLMADCMIVEKAGKTKSNTRALLRRAGLDPDDHAAVRDAYSRLVSEVLTEALPAWWRERPDHWGCLCFSRDPDGATPKFGTCMGDGSPGAYQASTCVRAIREEAEFCRKTYD
jgi:hypothetical protein